MVENGAGGTKSIIEAADRDVQPPVLLLGTCNCAVPRNQLGLARARLLQRCLRCQPARPKPGQARPCHPSEPCSACRYLTVGGR